MFQKLNKEYYLKTDVTQIAEDLLGKFLLTQFNGITTGGMIVETEAYRGYNDKACHANMNRRTKRTEIMYHEGGVAYVYLCYGMHYLFNIITNQKDKADAVLIRAIEPIEGISQMMERRKMIFLKPTLTSGPGVVSQALGINNSHYGYSLLENTIWIEDRGFIIDQSSIIKSPRVGIAYAEEDGLLPWRFRIKGNPWTSKPK